MFTTWAVSATMLARLPEKVYPFWFAFETRRLNRRFVPPPQDTSKELFVRLMVRKRLLPAGPW